MTSGAQSANCFAGREVESQAVTPTSHLCAAHYAACERSTRHEGSYHLSRKRPARYKILQCLSFLEWKRVDRDHVV